MVGGGGAIQLLVGHSGECGGLFSKGRRKYIPTLHADDAAHEDKESSQIEYRLKLILV